MYIPCEYLICQKGGEFQLSSDCISCKAPLTPLSLLLVPSSSGSSGPLAGEVVRAGSAALPCVPSRLGCQECGISLPAVTLPAWAHICPCQGQHQHHMLQTSVCNSPHLHASTKGCAESHILRAEMAPAALGPASTLEGCSPGRTARGITSQQLFQSVLVFLTEGLSYLGKRNTKKKKPQGKSMQCSYMSYHLKTPKTRLKLNAL